MVAVSQVREFVLRIWMGQGKAPSLTSRMVALALRTIWEMHTPRKRARRPLKHAFTRRTLLDGAAALAVALGSGGCAQAQGGHSQAPSKLAIIHTNDTHGHDLLDGESLGLAAVRQLQKDYEAKGYEVLTFDAGDAVQGDILVGHSKGDAAIDFLNLCGYDAMAKGNHEFDYGQHKIYEYIERANFPLLSANVVVDSTGNLMFAPRTTFTLADGTKVGVFGLTTPSTYTTTNPSFVQGFSFLQGDALYACAQEQANALRSEGCALVVCLAHLGESDMDTGNRTRDVAEHTVGIDLIIDGHDHSEENQVFEDLGGSQVLVVEAGCDGHAVGVVTWEGGELTALLEHVGSYEGQDSEVAAYIQGVADDIHAEIDGVIGHTDFALGEAGPGRPAFETNLGDFVTDAMMWQADQLADDVPDCAVINMGAVRRPIKEGDITREDILNTLPFVNYLCTIRISGAQLLEALEASAALMPKMAPSFPQVSGIKFAVDTRVAFESQGQYPNSTFNIPARPGSRVTIEDVGGRGFSLDDTYTVASIDFLCMGGDSYYVFSEAAGKTMKSLNALLSDSVIFYLTERCNGEVSEEYRDPAGQGRITVIV